MITNLIQFLMTPNEVLNNTLTCIFAFVEATLFVNFFIKLLNIESSNKQKYVYISLTAIIATIVKITINNSLGDIINLVTFIILVSTIFKQNIKNTFIALVTSYLGIFVSAYITQIILIPTLNIPLNYLSDIPFYRLISCLLTYLIFFVYGILITKRKKFSDLFKFSLKSTIILNLLCLILVIFIQSYIFSTYSGLPLNLEFIIILSLLINFFVSMYSLIRTSKLEQTEQELETEKLYNKTLTLLHDNIRCFKHDFNNIVQAIGGYVSLNDMDGLKDYYKQLLEDCKQTNNLNILNPETINNPSIYSLLNNKYYLASEKGINMTFNIFTDLSKINFNIYEFTRILGILLDNAIEAAQETDEKIINVEFRNDNKKQLFIIENSCKDNNISTTKIFEKGYSTKEKNSGIGLWKVHNILSKNTNIDLFTTVQNYRFKQQLEVFYN